MSDLVKRLREIGETCWGHTLNEAADMIEADGKEIMGLRKENEKLRAELAKERERDRTQDAQDDLKAATEKQGW